MTREKWRKEGGEYLRRGGTNSRHDEVEANAHGRRRWHQEQDYSPLTVPIWTVTTIIVNAGGKAWAPSPRAPNPSRSKREAIPSRQNAGRPS
jgi:hypothetical protein